MAYDHQINDDRVMGNSRVFSYSSLSSIEAAQGLNIEPVQAYLGAILAKLAVFFEFGHVQTILLLNIIFTALTAVVIFWIVILSGYSNLTGYSLGVMFGMCTIVWPYTRTYFRDPVAMFFLTLSWGGYKLLITEKARNLRSGVKPLIYWTILLFSLWIGIFSKNTVGFIIPVIAISYILEELKFRATNRTINASPSYRLISIVIVGLFFTVIVLWIKMMPTTGILSRFTFTYYKTVFQNIILNSHKNIFQAVIGPIISPGKSIFIFSPIIILSFIALIKHFKQAWPAWSYFLLLVVGQSLFYDSEWWGQINWGLRYLIPSIPLLVLSSTPVVENLLRTKSGKKKLISVGSLSIVMQLIGILAPVKQYYVALANSDPKISYFSMIWDPKYTAPWWHLKWIFSGGLPDLAITRIGFLAYPLVIILTILILVAIIVGIGKFNLRVAEILLFFTIISSGIMLSAFRIDPVNKNRNDLNDAQDKIIQYYEMNDIIIIKSYGTRVWSYWMNWADPELKWISLPFYFPEQNAIDRYFLSRDPTDVPNHISQQLIQNSLDKNDRVWLVVPGDSPGSNSNWEATYISQDAQLINYWVLIGGGNITHLYLYDSNKN